MFHERFCADDQQPIPLLQGWADLMKLTFKYWDPLVANFIVTAPLNFLNSNALEARKEFQFTNRPFSETCSERSRAISQTLELSLSRIHRIS